MQYLHYVPRPQDAALIGEAFATSLNDSRESRPAGFDEHGQGRVI
jgi:hypothetical protein